MEYIQMDFRDKFFLLKMVLFDGFIIIQTQKRAL